MEYLCIHQMSDQVRDQFNMLFINMLKFVNWAYSSMEKIIITMKIDVNSETLILNQDCEK